MKDEKRWPDTSEAEAHDVYFDKNKLATMAGWEQVGVEYSTVSTTKAERGHTVDVVI